MKIIGKCKKINPILPLYIVVGLLAVAIPVRTYQFLFITEGGTGFYKTIDWSVYVLYGLSAVALLVSYIFVYLAKNVPASKDEIRKKNPTLAIASVLFALGIIADSVMAFVSLLTVQVEQDAFFAVCVEAIFGLFSAIYILVFGISHFDGKTTYAQLKFLALAPLFWATGRMIVRILKKIAYVNVADLMLELGVLAFMMIFFLAFARISTGLANEKSMRSLFASGYACLFFCALANIPRVIVFITGNNILLAEEYPISISDLVCSIFIAAYIVNTMKKATVNDHDELYSKDDK